MRFARDPVPRLRRRAPRRSRRVQLFGSRVFPRQPRGANVQLFASRVCAGRMRDGIPRYTRDAHKPHHADRAGERGRACLPTWGFLTVLCEIRRRDEGPRGKVLPREYTRREKLHFCPSRLPRPYTRTRKLHRGHAPKGRLQSAADGSAPPARPRGARAGLQAGNARRRCSPPLGGNRRTRPAPIRVRIRGSCACNLAGQAGNGKRRGAQKDAPRFGSAKCGPRRAARPTIPPTRPARARAGSTRAASRWRRGCPRRRWRRPRRPRGPSWSRPKVARPRGRAARRYRP